jgi:hypothetical protein
LTTPDHVSLFASWPVRQLTLRAQPANWRTSQPANKISYTPLLKAKSALPGFFIFKFSIFLLEIQ